jgi:hypothetical protein
MSSRAFFDQLMTLSNQTDGVPIQYDARTMDSLAATAVAVDFHTIFQSRARARKAAVNSETRVQREAPSRAALPQSSLN